MKRVVVFALMLSVGNASAAVAGETLLEAAVRVADQVAAARESNEAARARHSFPAGPTRTAKPAAGANYQQTPQGLQESGIGRKTKLLLGLGVAAALAGVMLSIDGRVEDSTPSTKGERQTTPF